MEKSFQLDQKETAQLGQLDQARTNALATIGALLLDTEQAKKQLESVQERQRAFIQQGLANRGIERYENARAQNGALVVTLPDAPAMVAEPDESEVPRKRPVAHKPPNGQTIDVAKE